MYYDFAPQRENLFEKRCAKSQGHFTEQNHEDRRAKRSEIVLGGTMSDVLHVLTGILPVKCVLLRKTHGYKKIRRGAIRGGFFLLYNGRFPARRRLPAEPELRGLREIRISA